MELYDKLHRLGVLKKKFTRIKVNGRDGFSARRKGVNPVVVFFY